MPLGVGVTGWPAMLGDELRNPHATLAPDAPPAAAAHPWFWWGPLGAPPDPPCLGRLVASGSLSAAAAGLLAAAVRAGASVAAVAVPGAAGKTTLLSALAAALPRDRRPVHLRGAYEDFAAFSRPGVTPGTAAVLVNEISGHLPIYLWGQGVARLADLRARGFQILATAHARDARDLADVLAGPGAGLPSVQASGLFDLVARLEPGPRVVSIDSPLASGRPPLPLAGLADAPAAASWLSEAARFVPALAAIDPATLPAWETWASTPAAPAADPERPGAMLANRNPSRHPGPGSP